MSHRETSTVLERFGGAEGSRTPDPHNAIVVLYQLSYDPKTVSGRGVSHSSLRIVKG